MTSDEKIKAYANIINKKINSITTDFLLANGMDKAYKETKNKFPNNEELEEFLNIKEKALNSKITSYEIELKNLIDRSKILHSFLVTKKTSEFIIENQKVDDFLEKNNL